MKRIFFFLLFIAVCCTSYYDVTKGTLNKTDTSSKQVTTKSVTAKVHPSNTVSKKTQPDYKSIKIAPGNTVLSIVEKLNPSHHIPITTVISDFKKLNPNTNPNQIEIGKTYKFPIYSITNNNKN